MDQRCRRPLIVAITGTIASGKGVVAGSLERIGFARFSLSDAVRREASLRGIDQAPREVLQSIGNELRKEFGPAALARILSKQFTADRIVVDGVRNPGEIEYLRECGEFVLWAVDAPAKLRFERLRSRGREGDPTTAEEFLERDSRDLGTNEGEHGQQVARCIQIADAHIYTMGSEAETVAEVDEILEALGIWR